MIEKEELNTHLESVDVFDNLILLRSGNTGDFMRNILVLLKFIKQKFFAVI